MTFEQFQDDNVNQNMATLICDFIKIVAEKCILCDDEILGVVNAARRSFNLNHEKRGGKKTSKLKGNPYDIARNHGAIETRNAVELKILCPYFSSQIMIIICINYDHILHFCSL